jgi:hypothetical protein
MPKKRHSVRKTTPHSISKKVKMLSKISCYALMRNLWYLLTVDTIQYETLAKDNLICLQLIVGTTEPTSVCVL